MDLFDIRVQRLDEIELLAKAIDCYNDFKQGTVTTRSPPDLLMRIMVNYIRHEHVTPNYNKMVAGLDPQSSLAKRIKRAVLERIAEAYPILRREAARQRELI
jgi:hypothetical protein